MIALDIPGWEVYGDGETAYAGYGIEDGINERSVVFQQYVDETDRKAVRSSVNTLGGKLQVTHDFRFHPTIPNLSEISIIIKNVGTDTITDTRYRRVIDFNVSPTVSTLPFRQIEILPALTSFLIKTLFCSSIL